MKALDGTLLDLLKRQNGKLSKKHRKQVVELYTRLGEEANIYHNDSNVARNMMLDAENDRL